MCGAGAAGYVAMVHWSTLKDQLQILNFICKQEEGICPDPHSVMNNHSEVFLRNISLHLEFGGGGGGGAPLVYWFSGM